MNILDIIGFVLGTTVLCSFLLVLVMNVAIISEIVLRHSSARKVFGLGIALSVFFVAVGCMWNTGFLLPIVVVALLSGPPIRLFYFRKPKYQTNLPAQWQNVYKFLLAWASFPAAIFLFSACWGAFSLLHHLTR